ncbi:hypothetical protein [Pseudobacteriovorax antillogorgiicola]|uniref:Uncharacterized protein n=1 Tax=Pseudobacteriovorax antillogorgiicola TaxID=1513793 RepID=A0A1Y6CW84_9BACT|nr:hypothetical protein [Pseudobacteriovorax antillogorgiicola]TCS42734.1 hypothetical protein EDD56_1402 [Pseudobacteriovorax antillogorgiicola]SMF82164.1 hypothetical protein SAMN06296036_1402 [Pseudobacteriovorax antillogorgiicola]
MKLQTIVILPLAVMTFSCNEKNERSMDTPGVNIVAPPSVPPESLTLDLYRFPDASYYYSDDLETWQSIAFEDCENLKSRQHNFYRCDVSLPSNDSFAVAMDCGDSKTVSYEKFTDSIYSVPFCPVGLKERFAHYRVNLKNGDSSKTCMLSGDGDIPLDQPSIASCDREQLSVNATSESGHLLLTERGESGKITDIHYLDMDSFEYRNNVYIRDFDLDMEGLTPEYVDLKISNPSGIAAAWTESDHNRRLMTDYNLFEDQVSLAILPDSSQSIVKAEWQTRPPSGVRVFPLLTVFGELKGGSRLQAEIPEEARQLDNSELTQEGNQLILTGSLNTWHNHSLTIAETGRRDLILWKTNIFENQDEIVFNLPFEIDLGKRDLTHSIMKEVKKGSLIYRWELPIYISKP